MPGWRSIVRHAVKTSSASVIAIEGNRYIEKEELERRSIRACFKKPIDYDRLWTAITEHKVGSGP
jgi:BarA-like signal transduction histidine kinase